MPRDDLPSLTALRAFEATARLGSASKAADSLNITHGAVSRQIKLLEEELGGSLFVRHGRRLVLTDEGSTFAESCTQAFETIGTARRTFERAREGAPLILSCPGSLLARWLIPRLERLNTDLPGLRLHLVSDESMQETLNDDIDASLRFASPALLDRQPGHALYDEAIGPVMAPAVLERLMAGTDGHPAGTTWLKEYPLLHTTSRPQAWPQWARLNDIAVDDLTLGQGFEHLYYLLEAAEAGLGIAIAPKLLVEDAVARERLVAPWGFSQTGESLLLTYRNTISPKEQRRMDALSQWLGSELVTNDRPL